MRASARTAWSPVIPSIDYSTLVSIPRGTVVIRETKAPEGYKVNSGFVSFQKIQENVTTSAAVTFNDPEAPEEVVSDGDTETVGLLPLRDGARELVRADGQLSSHEGAALRHVAHAARSPGELAPGVHKPEHVVGVSPVSHFGEVRGRTRARKTPKHDIGRLTREHSKRAWIQTKANWGFIDPRARLVTKTGFSRPISCFISRILMSNANTSPTCRPPHKKAPPRSSTGRCVYTRNPRRGTNTRRRGW